MTAITAANKFVPGGGFSYMCTGGGAMVRFLSGEELPVVKAQFTVVSCVALPDFVHHETDCMFAGRF